MELLLGAFSRSICAVWWLVVVVGGGSCLFSWEKMG